MGTNFSETFPPCSLLSLRRAVVVPPVLVRAAAPWPEECQGLKVRRAFRENWQFLARSQSSQELIAKLEELTEVAFGKTRGLEAEDLLMWQLLWTDGDLATEAGAPPADEMLLMGLNATERKVVHQLARLIGLHSESRLLDDGQEGDETKPDKALALRPPRSLRCRAGSWAAPFSVSQVECREPDALVPHFACLALPTAFVEAPFPFPRESGKATERLNQSKNDIAAPGRKLPTCLISTGLQKHFILVPGRSR
eukprot:s481_g28.t1